jgi:hypothetical protein
MIGGPADQPSKVTIDTRRMYGRPVEKLDGTLTITYRLVSATDWDKLDRIGFIPPWARVFRSHFRDANRKRPRWRKPSTIIRSLAIYYLSTEGGGRLSRPDALARCQADPRLADIAANWDRSEHSKVLRELREDYGAAAVAPVLASTAGRDR